MKFNKKTIIPIILAIFSVAILVYCYPGPDEQRFHYKSGGVWNYSLLTAPFELPIPIDSVRAEMQADSIRNAFIPIYERKDDVKNSFMESLKTFSTDELSSHGSKTIERYKKKISGAYADGIIDDDTYNKMHSQESPMRIRLYNRTANKIGTPLSETHFTSPQKIQSDFMQSLDGTQTLLDEPIIEQYVDSLTVLIQPNIVYDDKQSNSLLGNELSHVYVSKGSIQVGGRIIDKGEPITPQLFALLQAYEKKMAQVKAESSGSAALRLVGEIVFVALMIMALMRFLYVSRRELYDNPKAMVCIFSLLVVFGVIASLVSSWYPAAVYMVPFAILPIVLNVFFDSRVGFVTSIVLLLLCLPFTQLAMEFMVVQFVALVAALYSIKEFSRRSQLLTAAACVLGAYIVSYLAVDLLLNGDYKELSVRMLAFFAVNAVLISIAYLFIFVLEKIFGFISVVTLVELSDINNSVLRQLSQECPGTFQHSMAVSNLASDAALNIGANVQLIRTGALYHDIGKLDNPAFFTENQHGVNPHSTLDPIQSAKIIIRHVNDGVRRADKAKLPQVIKDFILQHHGRGTAKYFYNTYCNAHPDEDVDPAQFTYPGPNPQSRETSILMMADAVEAASRSLKDYTVESITALVNKIIDGQIADGLHSEAPITFRDVKMIKESFIKRLRTIYHARVAYPERKAPEATATAVPTNPNNNQK